MLIFAENGIHILKDCKNKIKTKETLCGPQSLKHLLAEKEKVCQLFLLLKTIFSY